MKTYDVHTVRTYCQQIEADSAAEAKSVAERDGDGAEQINGPDVVGVYEVTGA
jgi:hypothetical protein